MLHHVASCRIVLHCRSRVKDHSLRAMLRTARHTQRRTSQCPLALYTAHVNFYPSAWIAQCPHFFALHSTLYADYAVGPIFCTLGFVLNALHSELYTPRVVFFHPTSDCRPLRATSSMLYAASAALWTPGSGLCALPCAFCALRTESWVCTRLSAPHAQLRSCAPESALHRLRPHTRARQGAARAVSRRSLCGARLVHPVVQVEEGVVTLEHARGGVLGAGGSARGSGRWHVGEAQRWLSTQHLGSTRKSQTCAKLDARSRLPAKVLTTFRVEVLHAAGSLRACPPGSLLSGRAPACLVSSILENCLCAWWLLPLCSAGSIHAAFRDAGLHSTSWHALKLMTRSSSPGKVRPVEREDGSSPACPHARRHWT